MKNKIRILRAERRWSQAELATRVGVSRNSINSIENGHFDPSLPLAFEIAAAFGCAIEEVFERDAGSPGRQHRQRDKRRPSSADDD